MFVLSAGINGWYAVYVPTLGWDTGCLEADTPLGRPGAGMERVVGGLEVSVKFAHAEDLNRVISAAKSVGWDAGFDMDNVDWDSTGE